MKHILVLAANPQGTSPLRLDHEVREIDQALRASPLRDEFELHQRWALRPRDLQRALLDVNPAIVHFCGHGEGTAGIALEDPSGQPQLVSTEALGSLFGLCADRVSCVLLNACHAEVQADEIVKSIDYVIGMRKAVPDDVAISFATGFYQGLGSGQTIEAAFQNGCDAILKSQGNMPDRGEGESPTDKRLTDKRLRDIVLDVPMDAGETMSDDQIPVLKKKTYV
ncbi:MAG: CHAT domain-containing protein [Cyanobacteria bacterium P01_F01_bin.53]